MTEFETQLKQRNLSKMTSNLFYQYEVENHLGKDGRVKTQHSYNSCSYQK